MPSREALAMRRTAANERLNTGLAGLTARLGIDNATIGATAKDPDVAAVMQVEQMADAVEAIAERITQGAAPAEETAAASDEQNDEATKPAKTAAATSTAPDAPRATQRRRTPAKDR